MVIKQVIARITSARKTNREAKILHNFKNQLDVRLNLLLNIVDGKAPPPADLTPKELVVIFSLLLNRYSLDDVIQRMMVYSNEGFAKKFNDDFFFLLDQTSKSYRRLGLIENSDKLVTFGKTVAQAHGNLPWTGKFEQRFYQRIEHQIQYQFRTG